MANQLTTPGDPIKEFQAKLIEKLKVDIGTLMPDEVLRGLIERAVNEQFFKPRQVVNRYGDTHSTEPSWFVVAVIEAARPMLDREVKAWVDRHQDTLKKTLHEFLDDNNLMLTALATMRMHLNSDLITWTSDLAGQVAQRIRNGF